MSTKTKSPEDWLNEKGRWEFISDWKVEEQSNDRMQARGTVTSNDGRPISRSMARRQHQINYKRWSQERTD